MPAIKVESPRQHFVKETYSFFMRAIHNIAKKKVFTIVYAMHEMAVRVWKSLSRL